MHIPESDPIPSLLQFIAGWVTDLSDRHRMPSRSLPDFLPPPLRSIYEHTGNYPIPNAHQWRHPTWKMGLFGPQDQLVPVDRLEVRGDRFSFLHENQGVWWCETLANHPDPPVFSNAQSCQDQGDDLPRQVPARLSHFMTTYCLQELVFGSKYLFCAQSVHENFDELLTQKPGNLWTDGFYVHDQPTHSFYACGDNMLLSDHYGNLWIGVNNERALSLLRHPELLDRLQ